MGTPLALQPFSARWRAIRAPIANCRSRQSHRLCYSLGDEGTSFIAFNHLSKHAGQIVTSQATAFRQIVVRLCSWLALPLHFTQRRHSWSAGSLPLTGVRPSRGWQIVDRTLFCTDFKAARNFCVAAYIFRPHCACSIPQSRFEKQV